MISQPLRIKLASPAVLVYWLVGTVVVAVPMKRDNLLGHEMKL